MTGPWLLRPPSAEAAGRVFCIPHAGCGAGIFGKWPAVRQSVEFLPVELPGRLTRMGDRMPATFQDLAAAVIDGLGPYLDVPYAFFGHCWSALAAYEITAQLEQRGRKPAHLFVSSQVAPQDGPVGKMLGMTEDELTEELKTTIRDLGNQPHPELVAIYAKVLRDDVEASRRYLVPDPVRLACPVTAIGWRDDAEVRPESMTGWAACGDTTFEVFPGRHHEFTDAPPALLHTLSSALLAS